MRILVLALFLSLPALLAQTPPAAPAIPDLADDTVLATFEDGVKFTMRDFKALFAVLSPQQQQTALLDRRNFVQQYAFMRKLAQLAVVDRLDERSPAKEALEYYRMNVLLNAKLVDAMNTAIVEPADVLKAYNANRDRYRQVKVRALYIAFGGTGKKPLTEAEALAKAGKLLAQIRSGADFGRLVKEHSDDPASAAKDGDFGTLRRGDNMPDAIRTAVFGLKEGETSEPVKQAGGFYLLRAHEVGVRPLSEVRDEIFNELKQWRYKQWLEETNRNVRVKVDSEAFFNAAPPPPPAPAPAK
jgi:parvulin-like peptidyl-prolyl isomerase